MSGDRLLPDFHEPRRIQIKNTFSKVDVLKESHGHSHAVLISTSHVIIQS